MPQRYRPCWRSAAAIARHAAAVACLGYLPAAATAETVAAKPTIQLDVRIDSLQQRIEVVQRIALDTAVKHFSFVINPGLQVTAIKTGGSAPGGGAPGGGAPANGAPANEAPATTRRLGGDRRLSRHEATFSAPVRQIVVHYSGSPTLEHNPLGNFFDAAGLWLSGESSWYAWPVGAGAPSLFTLSVNARHASWQCLSQGARVNDSVKAPGEQVSAWQEAAPQADIQLVCGQFSVAETSYGSTHGDVSLATWLLSPDAALSTRYLDAARQYLGLYEPLLGKFPYTKFALVENRAPTGFGMPSFTLLGSRVIRLPFIAHTSFPHELVHNWLGNGIYVDPALGNWSEGLTTYLADHALAELRGQGRDYRRNALARLAVQSAASRRYPLREFRARATALDSAIGYDLPTLLFHQVRETLGDAEFRASVRELTANARFTRVNFAELAGYFDTGNNGPAARAMLLRWLDETALPELALEQAVFADGAVTGRLLQTQPGKPFALRVPAVITHVDGSRQHFSIDLTERSRRFSVASETPPARIDIDPGASILRLLPRAARPPQLGETLATATRAFIHPTTREADRQRYEMAARAMGLQEISIALPPDDKSAWLMGHEFIGDADIGTTAAKLAQLDGAAESNCRAVAVRPAGRSAIWLDCDKRHDKHHDPHHDPHHEKANEPLTGLSRSVRHYGNRGVVLAAAPGERRATGLDWPWPSGQLSHVFSPGQPFPPDDAPALLGPRSASQN